MEFTSFECPQISSGFESDMFNIFVQWTWKLSGDGTIAPTPVKVFAHGFSETELFKNSIFREAEIKNWYNKTYNNLLNDTPKNALNKMRVLAQKEKCARLADYRFSQSIKANYSLQFETQDADKIFIICIIDENSDEMFVQVHTGSVVKKIEYRYIQPQKSFWPWIKKITPARIELCDEEIDNRKKVLIATVKGAKSYSILPYGRSFFISDSLKNAIENNCNIEIYYLVSLINSN